MKLYNSLTRTVQEFVPNDNRQVNVYTCGPTVYNFAHIGNLRSYLMEDILIRTLKYNGYNVKRVMNITDVGHLSGDNDYGEDKMLKGAEREHKTIKELALFYTNAFFEDFKALNILPPDVCEPATNCIDDFIKVISALLDKGYAYISGGNVYFDTSKLENYHVFYSFNKDDLEVGVRDGVNEDASKRHPNDFALWFTKSKFDNQALRWESPWGTGYPGWHIECSCIAMKHLGEHVDIHCGGIDNAFPHHTNEIAQSEAYLGHKWCNYWMHVLHLQDKNGKMSKSSGEFLTLKVLTSKGYTPNEYRFFCLQSHYRKPLLFTYEILDNTVNAYKKLIKKISNIVEAGEVNQSQFDEYKHHFLEAINNDLNTSMAITVLYDLIKDKNLSGATKIALIKDFDTVLALDLLNNQTTNAQMNENALDDEQINALIEKRLQAKKNKDYALADQIRADLLDKGIALIDTKDGTTFERK